MRFIVSIFLCLASVNTRAFDERQFAIASTNNLLSLYQTISEVNSTLKPEFVCTFLGRMDGISNTSLTIFKIDEVLPTLESLQKYPGVLSHHFSMINEWIQSIMFSCLTNLEVTDDEINDVLKSRIALYGPSIKVELDRIKDAINGKKCTDVTTKCPWINPYITAH